jgi:hypothetical protein
LCFVHIYFTFQNLDTTTTSIETNQQQNSNHPIQSQSSIQTIKPTVPTIPSMLSPVKIEPMYNSHDDEGTHHYYNMASTGYNGYASEHGIDTGMVDQQLTSTDMYKSQEISSKLHNL